MLNCIIYLIIHYLLFVMPVMLTLMLIFFVVVVVIFLWSLLLSVIWFVRICGPRDSLSKTAKTWRNYLTGRSLKGQECFYFCLFSVLRVFCWTQWCIHVSYVFRRAAATDTKPVCSYLSLLLHLNASYQLMLLIIKSVFDI